MILVGGDSVATNGIEVFLNSSCKGILHSVSNCVFVPGEITLVLVFGFLACRQNIISWIRWNPVSKITLMKLSRNFTYSKQAKEKIKVLISSCVAGL